MGKVLWKPGTMLYPVPAVMVSCRHNEIDNIITVSWAGTICTNPPMVSVSIRPERYSYNLIKASGEFIINLPGRELAFAADFCGVNSGRDMDKFLTLGLEKEQGNIVNVPIIKKAALAIECRVKDIKKLGSHHMFLADVVGVDADERYIDSKGRLHLDKAELICYNHGQYCVADKGVGTFGYSVKKKKFRNNR